MYPQAIEVGGEEVSVEEVIPLAECDMDSTARASWRNQGVTNVLRVRRKGEIVLVLEYGPGHYEFQRRYSLQGDERAGRGRQPGDNPL